MTHGPNDDPSLGLQEMHTVETTQLKLGTRLRVPIYSENDVLLLAAGQRIEPTFLERLRNYAIFRVKVHETEQVRVLAGRSQGQSTLIPPFRMGMVCAEANSLTGNLDRMIRQGVALGMPPQEDPFAKHVRSRGLSLHDERLQSAVIDHHIRAVGELDEIYETLGRNRPVDVEGLSAMPETALSLLAEDPDLYACLGMNPLSGTYPARHGVHTQMLAIAMGLNLGLNRQTLKELALGCLIHDSGMLRISKEAYDRPGELSPAQFAEITKHPIRVFDAVSQIRSIPHRSAFIAYQIHERCNGEGYPRRRKGSQIHFLAKIAGVADAYIALVAPRPHREGILPYKAIESILHGVKQGLFDGNTVRALLRTTSLFPLGSFVELTDGRVGRVIRANDDQFSSPVVEAWTPHSLDTSPDVVDLSQEPELSVKRPLPALPEMASSSFTQSMAVPCP